ncbi:MULTISPECIES: hypothetical protein [Roseateles]|uniref:Uncharacterized protein n=1 Tax=Pelomonas caseinilytica TaxID=2906763 RepID=A0ABS8XH59_9BURK|nr:MULTISPECIES: hypothetical protein [unclassified Roseateles]MCE4540204.1 hypothetical protein [Pelomonas sp. P7]HEV6968478.1 hypothetical protein [Roseateles sp.]
MQTFSASQQPWSNSKFNLAAQARPRTAPRPGAKPETCGWYDSSFDLATGLEVDEQADDTLYQLWQLSQR